MRSRTLLLILCVIFGCAILVTGCKQKPNKEVITPTGRGPSCGNVSTARAINAIPDIPAIDIYANDMPLQCGLAFKCATDYADFKPDQYCFTVYPTGDKTTPIITQQIDLKSKETFTIFAIGTKACAKTLVLRDDRSTPPAGYAKVRFVHAVPDGPCVTIRTKDGNEKFADSLAFGEATGYKDVKNGQYSVVAARSDDACGILAALECMELQSGHIYTVALEGMAADNSVVIVVYLDK